MASTMIHVVVHFVVLNVVFTELEKKKKHYFEDIKDHDKGNDKL